MFIICYNSPIIWIIAKIYMCVTRPEQVSFIKKLLCDVYYVCLKLETEDYTRL